MSSFEALLEAERRRQRLHRVVPFDWQLGLTHGPRDLDSLPRTTPTLPIGVTPTLQVVSPHPLRRQTRQTATVEVGAAPHIKP